MFVIVRLGALGELGHSSPEVLSGLLKFTEGR
jgi:hypothetical protein